MDLEIYSYDTDDELEMEFFRESGYDQVKLYLPSTAPSSSSSSSSSLGPSIIERFVSMGFAEKLVIRAIDENGEHDVEAIVNSLLAYELVENSPGADYPCSSATSCSLDGYLSDGGSGYAEDEASRKHAVAQDYTISYLVEMGYHLEDAVTAAVKCGYDAPLEDLTDFIYAANMDASNSSTPFNLPKKRKPVEVRCSIKRKLPTRSYGAQFTEPKRSRKMLGFGIPNSPMIVRSRNLPEIASGPPYFYYENVACTPKGVWEQISRFLYEIEPEFVDSLHFSAAARKRGYIHNLPIGNRQPLLPIPPKTIHAALPDTRKWWPEWDKRQKLNCLLTSQGTAKLTERIRKKVESGHPSEENRKFVIKQCKKWNLVWVGKHKVAILEPYEMEMLLGFPYNHTRGGGISRTDRYKALGNTFQVDTVAYHLSVLKPLYANGMNVLSLFSGIGGAEVALHRLGIHLKTVVSVEISETNRRILNDWWKQSGQTGKLIHAEDVQSVEYPLIDSWIEEFGGFDLVIGGSPCNNLAGANRRTRNGLQGEHSSLFFHYYRILDAVRTLMRMRTLP